MIRWIWGLPLAALIWWFAVQAEKSPIEIDLKHRAEAALLSNGIGWADARFDGIDGAVSGRAYSEDQRTRASDLVAKVWGVWQVADQTGLVEQLTNYKWGASASDGEVRLVGYFPDPDARKAVLAAAKAAFPNHEIQDRMKPARGVGDRKQWLSGVEFSLKQLAFLKSGSANLTGMGLTVDGEARDTTTYARVMRNLKRTIPAHVQLVANKIRPPVVDPFTWSAKLTPTALSLAGYVPNEAARELLMTAAKAAFPKLAIVDKMATAGGAPRGWIDTAKALIDELGHLQSGDAAIEGKTITFKGVAQKQVTAEGVQSRLEKIAAHFDISHNISYLQATIPTISPYVTNILKDKARITLSGYAPSQAEIDRLIAAARRLAGGIDVVSTLAIANGAPEGWRLCSAAGLEGLARLDAGRAEIVARRLAISGTTSDEDVGLNLPGVVRAAANRACEDVVEIKLDLPPEPDLNWSARSDDKSVTLEGEVTNSDVRTALMERAKLLFPKRSVHDQMRIKPARSNKWPQVAAGLLELLAKLRQGEAMISGQSVKLTGQVPDTAAATAIKARMKRGLAKGYTGGPVLEIKSDAMIWAEQEAKRQAEARRLAEEQRRDAEEARRKAEAAAAEQRAEEERKRRFEEARREAEAKRRAEDNRLVKLLQERRARLEAERQKREAAERQRQEEIARRKAEAKAKRKAEDERLVRLLHERRAQREAQQRQRAEAERRQQLERERQKQAARERQAGEERARQARQQEEQARLQAAKAEQLRKQEQVRRAADEAARVRAEKEAKRRDEDERLLRLARERRTRIATRQRAKKVEIAKQCDEGFRRTIERNRIRFRFNSAYIREPSRATLDRIAELIKGCNGMRIEISGHTDSMGRIELNRALSEQRAEAVRAYLEKRGVAPGRLIAKGFGEAKPRFANNSATNRALNRRIEFKALVE